MCVCVSLVTQLCLTVTARTAAHQDPLFMELSRQGYWSRLPFPSPEGLPNPGVKPSFLHCRHSIPTEPPGNTLICFKNPKGWFPLLKTSCKYLRNTLKEPHSSSARVYTLSLPFTEQHILEIFLYLYKKIIVTFFVIFHLTFLTSHSLFNLFQ